MSTHTNTSQSTHIRFIFKRDSARDWAKKKTEYKNCTSEYYNIFGPAVVANIKIEERKKRKAKESNEKIVCYFTLLIITFSYLFSVATDIFTFQINSSTHQQQTVTEYAKPNQGVSYSHQETTIHHDQLDSMLGAWPNQSQLIEIRRFFFVIFSFIFEFDFFAGSLQENMNRQGVTTTQKGCCSACDKPIVGQVITALGRTWHPEHFTCSHCCQELGTRNFFERDGHPYCEPDYHNLFSPRCAYCNGAILDVRLSNDEKPLFFLEYNRFFFCVFVEMRYCIGQDLAHRAFLLRPMRPTIRRRRLPWTRWKTILSQRLLRYVRTKMQRMQSRYHGKLYFSIECSMACWLLCLSGKFFFFLVIHFLCFCKSFKIGKYYREIAWNDFGSRRKKWQLECVAICKICRILC